MALLTPTLEQVAGLAKGQEQLAIDQRIGTENLQGNKNWAAQRAREILKKYGTFTDKDNPSEGATSWTKPAHYHQTHRQIGVDFGYRLSTTPVAQQAGAVALSLGMWSTKPRYSGSNDPDKALTVAQFYDGQAVNSDPHFNNGDIYIYDPGYGDLGPLSTPEELKILQDTLDFIADSEKNRSLGADIEKLKSYVTGGY